MAPGTSRVWVFGSVMDAPSADSRSLLVLTHQGDRTHRATSHRSLAGPDGRPAARLPGGAGLQQALRAQPLAAGPERDDCVQPAGAAGGHHEFVGVRAASEVDELVPRTYLAPHLQPGAQLV